MDEGYQNMQAERLEVAVAKTTAIEHLDFEIDALRKAVIDPINKVVQDLVPPVTQGAHKLLERFVGISLSLLFLGSILFQLLQQVALILPVAMQTFATMAASGKAIPTVGLIEILTTALWSLVFVVVAVWRFGKLEL